MMENKKYKLGKLTVHLQLGNLFDQWRKLGENTSQAAAEKYKMYFDIIDTQCYLLFGYDNKAYLQRFRRLIITSLV